MALKVIGAGWGRTGTESLKSALEELGFQKCYHMFEIVNDPERVLEWEKLSRNEKPDFDRIFDGYAAAVDFPVARYYKEILASYPDAKVILTLRDPEAWFESASKTIFRKPPKVFLILLRLLSPFFKRFRYLLRLVDWIEVFLYAGFFAGRRGDRAYMVERFHEWTEEVKRTVPPAQLLVFEVKQGWDPLCAFLGVPVPTKPFPRSNDSSGFENRVAKKAMFGKE